MNLADMEEQIKTNMNTDVYCEKCDYEFSIEDVGLHQEKMEVDGLKFDLIYFYCPKCKKIYRVSIQDKKYYLLVEELEKVNKQIRNNFGTYNTARAEKLSKSVKKKSRNLKNHVLEMNKRFDGEFAFFIDSKGNKTIEYIKNENFN